MLSALILAVTAGVGAASGQTGQAAAGPAVKPAPAMLLEIVLERKRDGKVETMAAGHVFDTGDVVRLRLRSQYNGHLYVLDQGTSGRFATIFPAADSGTANRIEDGAEYLVPAVPDGWFEVQGPAGFDVLYFVLSPTALAQPPAGSFVAPGPLSSLKPRCNDKVFRARGDCVDDTAGPAVLPRGTAVPAPLQPMAGSAARDLVFSKKDGAVGVSGQPGAPVIYEFRLAHKDRN